MSKARAFNFHELPSSDDDEHPPPARIAHLQHTNFGRGTRRGPGSRITHIPNIASPEKVNRRPPSPDIVWNDDPSPPEIDVSSCPWIDPEYVHEHFLEDLGPRRRAPRPAAVSI